MYELALYLCKSLIVYLILLGNGLLHVLQYLYLLFELFVLAYLGRAYAGVCTAFVHKVDSLIGQEAVCDVSLGEHSAHSHKVIGDVYLVELLVVFLYAHEDVDCVLDGGLVDCNRLETALKSGILLDILAVLAECGGTDYLDLAS